MTREIKFRAWDTTSKKMYQSYAVADYSIGELEAMSSNKENTFTYFMQFTGLKDKNGTEIYEGDIVKSNKMYHEPSQIIFYANGWCFDVPNSGKDGWCVEIKGDATIEVIGNIYENSNLMEKQDDRD